MAQSLKRVPAQNRRVPEGKLLQNGGDMPIRKNSQREQFAADQKNVSDAHTRRRDSFVGALMMTACEHNIPRVTYL